MERSILTCKDRFILRFSTTDLGFPIREWDRLLFQLFITLNLLSKSRVSPDLSVYAHLYGSYSFNKSPMEPPGTHVVVHVKPGICTSWSHQEIIGWYISPYLDHYRCIQCYMPATSILCINNTLQYTQKHFLS